MARRHVHHAQIITAFVRIPGALEDGKVRCAACSAVVGLTPNGNLRKHRTPAGEDCAHHASYAAPVHLDDLPPVNIPPESRPPARTSVQGRSPSTRPKVADIEQDARLAPRNNECVDCGRWLPGERSLCGKCSRRRNIERGSGA